MKQYVGKNHYSNGEVSWSSCQPNYFRVAFDFNLLEVSVFQTHIFTLAVI